ncbi:probable phosphorylase b kinase regulatory subunit alpha isoform X1 [Drosophila biarmipes]|uniref:probable phosphorylase b kinase regulatory subunit alpha isoform X1 n=1 Tax=Drosophila biarmipes TaxID=125945 RepID=UPI0007E7457B|nr:probable phosphorylase b kinase regulatory subunit alpha isoform X1 [Drosophila biarmipes]XP_043949398.1 probable phosphorylase b kinase regulatory subunit alpha isoform X1 [Drosophila biarmipes]
MRSRSNSGVRLDYYQRIVHRLILAHQEPVTGLFPASNVNSHAWIRDNVYCILAVWGLSMAYKKIADQDEDRAKCYELEQSCVKLMRGLLMAMMNQKDKVEKFKMTQSPYDSLHAKYSSKNGLPVVGDNEWGHLQIDAVSLYLLILAQMTASGLQIVFSLDEVSFIQNLVFYIESAYSIPDYGIWERGDKTNHGEPELNASSIGMAKAALEAMNELDLFGARGGPASVIHVLADEAHKCQAVLQSMLPRESNSKELDSGLLCVIGFPAFAVDDAQLIHNTKDAILSRLQGKYGCKRFLRDGYRTPKEDPSRLYYERWELRMFENIECEWPLFYCYLILFHAFQSDKRSVEEYASRLEKIMVRSEDGILLVPESYAVPQDLVGFEYQKPGSQAREVVGRCPFLWGQSLFILGRLLQEGFLAVGELDPLNRRLGAQKKPDVVVQVVIIAEDNEIRDKLAEHDLHVQTIAEVAPIEVQPARVLSHLYTYLGRNRKLGLSGRKSRDVGILSTSKLYSLKDRIFAFTPQHIDYEEYYTTRDPDLLASNFTTNLAFLTNNWRHMLGRPTITLMATHYMLDQDKIPLAMIQTMRKLKSGYINGTRVMLGSLKDFLNTSAITDLSFLGSTEDGYPDRLHPDVQTYLDEHLLRSFSNRSTMNLRGGQLRPRTLRRRMSCKGAIKKTRSINVDSDNLGMEGPSPLTERRLSSIVPPPWLQANKQSHVSVFATTPEEGPANSPLHLGNELSVRENIYPVDPHHSRSAIDRRSEFVRQQEITVPKILIQRHRAETNFADTEVEELIAMLRETENLEEQGDILQYLVDTQGLDFNTAGLGFKNKSEDNVTPDANNAAAELEQAFVDEVVLELAGGAGEGAKKSPTIVLPTVIIDAATIPAATSSDADGNANPGAATATAASAGNTRNASNNSNISSSSIGSNTSNHNNMSPHENNNDSSQSEGMLEEGRVVTVRDLLKGLYEKACQQKLWGLVRHTAGMLGKRVEDLAKAVTDLLVRQKQVTVGMPPNNEHTITAPLPEVELRQLIHDAYGDDESTAMLTQELMVYLAMFIRTEPQLFHEMLRLRVGLIIQVMAKELSRTLNCDGEAASEHLLNLSPFEMKNLLYHILSGKEFAVSSVARGNLSIVSCKSSRVSKKSQIGLGDPEGEDALIATIDDRQGQWLRRRRLDGALNRVPRDFYSRVWTVLEKCQGLAIEGRVLQQSLTQEMTPGELKFALEVETALNQIPQPEYRQLVVEALMVLTLVTEHNMVPTLGGIIYVEHLVHKANQLFLEDQRKVQGDATLCCAKIKDGKEQQQAASGMLLCGGAAYICQHLYDSAPSGSYGTMTYMSRAVALVLDCVPKHGEMECAIS